MPRSAEAVERIEPADLAAWRAWLTANHARAESVWLVAHKRASPGFAFTLDDAVEEALCFGWIDSLPRKLDEQRTMLLFAPRKTASGWSAVNKARVAKLVAEGRMTAAGQAKIDAAKADGSWDKLDAIERLLLPGDLAAALEANPPARTAWEAFPRSVKRGVLEWIAEAKRPETRAKRIAETAVRAQRGERANQWRGG